MGDANEKSAVRLRGADCVACAVEDGSGPEASALGLCDASRQAFGTRRKLGSGDDLAGCVEVMAVPIEWAEYAPSRQRLADGRSRRHAGRSEGTHGPGALSLSCSFIRPANQTASPFVGCGCFIARFERHAASAFTRPHHPPNPSIPPPPHLTSAPPSNKEPPQAIRDSPQELPDAGRALRRSRRSRPQCHCCPSLASSRTRSGKSTSLGDNWAME